MQRASSVFAKQNDDLVLRMNIERLPRRSVAQAG
jgi:hypothetical protein